MTSTYDFKLIRQYLLQKLYRFYKINSLEELFKQDDKGIGQFLGKIYYDNRPVKDIVRPMVEKIVKLQRPGQEFWHFLRDSYQIKKCRTCGKDNSYINWNVGFTTFCGNHVCVMTDPEIRQKILNSKYWQIVMCKKYYMY